MKVYDDSIISIVESILDSDNFGDLLNKVETFKGDGKIISSNRVEVLCLFEDIIGEQNTCAVTYDGLIRPFLIACFFGETGEAQDWIEKTGNQELLIIPANFRIILSNWKEEQVFS